jgi:hypothetical protein
MTKDDLTAFFQLFGLSTGAANRFATEVLAPMLSEIDEASRNFTQQGLKDFDDLIGREATRLSELLELKVVLRDHDKRCRLPMPGRGSAPTSGRARLPALRRGSRQDSYIPAQLQAMLPGTRFRRALPALSCPSPVEAPHASAVVPKRMMPKAAPARTANPRGSTALAPLPKVPEGVPR